MTFKDKVVIVTGGSSGIGAATAIELTKQGADVVIVGRNQEKLDNVTEKCVKCGKKPLVINADLVKDKDVKRIIELTIEQYGKLDVLVNNAGAAVMQPFGNDDDMEHFDSTIALNLRSAVHLANLALPHLTKTKGNIVNVSSIAAIHNVSNLWAYCAAKAGLDHFTRAIASELAPKGIRVNVVNPGPVRTDFMLSSAKSHDFMNVIRNITALQRMSEPEEIADVILFLASDKAKGVTGANWVIDNGMLLKGCMLQT